MRAHSFLSSILLLLLCLLQTVVHASLLTDIELVQAGSPLIKSLKTKTKTKTKSAVTTSSIPGATVIVSPTACPPTQPTGSLIEQSSSKFTKAVQGLQYQQYENDQYVFQDHADGPFFVDASDPNALAISINGTETLIIRTDGTFDAFVSGCQAHVSGIWDADASNTTPTLRTRQAGTVNSGFCGGQKKMCGDAVKFVISSTPVLSGSIGVMCKEIGNTIGVELGVVAGGAVGGPFGAVAGAAAGRLFGTILCTIAIQNVVANKVCSDQVCSDIDLVEATNRCSSSTGYGQAIYCCSGACQNDCTWMSNLCLDLQSGSPSCSSDQVFFPGNPDDVDVGEGKCWIEASWCTWVRNNWHWKCCDCPANYTPVAGASTCQVGNDPVDGAGGPPILPCMGCTNGKKLQGDASNGFFCNW